MATDPDTQNSASSETFLSGSTSDSATLSALLVQDQCVPEELDIDACVTALVHTLSIIFSCLTQMKVSEKTSVRPGMDAFTSRVNDVIR